MLWGMAVRFPGLIALPLVLLGAAPPLAITAYRCDTPQGPSFSQFPCAGEAEAVVLDAAATVQVPPLSAAEQRRLEGIDQEAAARRAERDSARARSVRAAQRQRAEAHKQCAAARSGLEKLERQRRKGYTLDQARELDRREAELTAAARATCHP